MNWIAAASPAERFSLFSHTFRINGPIHQSHAALQEPYDLERLRDDFFAPRRAVGERR